MKRTFGRLGFGQPGSVSLAEAAGAVWKPWIAGVALLGCSSPAWAADAARQDPAEWLPPMLVVGVDEVADDGWSTRSLPGLWRRVPAAADVAAVQDTAGLLADLPGAAVVRNGAQTGIVQLRGLSGDRVRVLVDGATITPACPNHMDPPLHYVAASAVRSITVMAGVTPVSAGGDSLAGTVQIDTSALRFATNRTVVPFGELRGTFRGSNDGWDVGAAGGAGDDRLAAVYQGSWQTGEDLRFPGGRVRDTGYQTQQHGVQTGFRTPTGQWSADARWTRTREAGTPALPMDMIEDDGWLAGARHVGDYGFGLVEGRVYHHEIEHLMDNYSLRPAAGARMFSPATSDDTGFSLGTRLPRGTHSWGVGADFHLNAFDAYQQNAGTGARQDTLNDATRQRAGLYTEWQAAWSDRWMTLVGLRGDAVWSDAAGVGRFYPASAADAAAFNATDHDRTEANLDAMAGVRFRPGDGSHYELSFARKNRAPSLLERYLWTPLSASAGMADGRTYLGDLDLDSETSHQVAASGIWHGRRWEARVTPFYNRVGDYIQGTPVDRLDAAGRRVLQFRNLSEAELYGAEGAFEFTLVTNLVARTRVSYVRGLDLDNDDNLYRIAPLRGDVELEYQVRGWRARALVEWAARQDDVAEYNDEPPTPGYALLHLEAGYRFRRYAEATVGLANVFDDDYAQHLGGINRVAGGDVAVGERLPGAGRFVYASLRLAF